MKESKAENFLNWLIELTSAFIICMLIILFVAQISFVRMDSMIPTIRNDDVILVEKISPRFNLIRRNDIITIRNDFSIMENTEILIKRVIGVAGDNVEIKDGKVYLNGTVLKEPYMNGDSTKGVKAENSSVTVPEGSVYVLGDNRLVGASLDSRSFGPIKVSQIKGKTFIRIFPFKEFGFIN
jgi:signal peptidase I